MNNYEWKCLQTTVVIKPRVKLYDSCRSYTCLLH